MTPTACQSNPAPFDVLIDTDKGPRWRRARNEARRMCRECPVQSTCLPAALVAGEQWAGAVLGVPVPRSAA